MSGQPPDSTPPFKAFLEQYWKDKEFGVLRPLEEYLRRFPGDEVGIAAEFVSLQRGRKAQAPEPGTQIGNYRILHELGRGGQATVYLAQDLGLGRKVALKVLEGLGPAQEEVLARFRREALAASMLQHAGICAVYEAKVDSRVPYIAMQYVEGETLARRIASTRERRVPTDTTVDLTKHEQSNEGAITAVEPLGQPQIMEAVAILEKVALALHIAHEKGIMHRDIKPGNIMVTPNCEPVILDFGLARQEDSDLSTLTRTGDLFGTPQYMSPEQLTRQTIRLDRRTDIWSLGVTLYECLALCRPFDAPTREGLYQSILTKTPPDLRRLNRSVSRDLAVVVAIALEKDRDRRYQTALDLASDLRRVREHEPIAARPIGPLGRLARWAAREPVKALLLLMLLITLPALAALVTSRVKDRSMLERGRLAQTQEEKEVRLANASYELAEGSTEHALAMYREIVAMEGGSPEAAAGAVLALLKMSEPRTALETLGRHADLLGGGVASRMLRADALRALKQTKEADALLENLPLAQSAVDHAILAQRAMLEAEKEHEFESPRREPFAKALHHATRAILLHRAPRLDLMALRAHAAGHIKDTDVAAETAAALRRHWPHVAGAHYWAGWALTKSGDLDGALVALKDAIKVYPEDFVASNALAAVLCMKGQDEAAIPILREIVSRRPEHANAWLNLGLALGDSGDLDGASAAHREAARLNPTSANTHSSLGNTLKRRGEFDAAIAAHREALRLQPHWAAALVNYGVALQAKGDIDAAIQAYRDAILKQRDFANAYRGLGTLLIERGEVAAAIEALRDGGRMAPRDAQIRFLLGLAYLRAENADSAVAAYREAVALDPNYAEAYADLGSALKRKGDISGAIASTREAIRLRSDFSLFHHNLGSYLGIVGDVPGAIAAYREAVRLNPDHPDSHDGLGHYMCQSGDVWEGIAHYRAAISLRPEYAEAHCNLGHGLWRVGRWRDAVDSLRRGHELGSARPGWPWDSAAWLNVAEKQLAGQIAAEAEIRRQYAAGKEPETAAAMVALARALHGDGRPGAGVDWFVKAFAHDPALGQSVIGRHLFHGARAAVLAAEQAGDALTATTLRERALSWLRAEASAWESRRNEDTVKEEVVRSALQDYLHDEQLSKIRGPALLRLPELEARAFNAFWMQVGEAIENLR